MWLLDWEGVKMKKIKKLVLKDLGYIVCPKCKSKEVVSCKGSTCLKPIPSINWICTKCLYEW